MSCYNSFVEWEFYKKWLGKVKRFDLKKVIVYTLYMLFKTSIVNKTKLMTNIMLFPFSGEGSHQSGCSEDRTPGAMARAITVHADTKKVMYFA